MIFQCIFESLQMFEYNFSIDLGLDTRDVCFISSDVYTVTPPSTTNSTSRKRTKCQPKSQSLPSDYRGARQRMSRNKRSHLAVASKYSSFVNLKEYLLLSSYISN